MTSKLKFKNLKSKAALYSCEVRKLNEAKLRDVFADMVVMKKPDRAKFFSDLSLPAYMRDWLVMKFADEDGNVDTNGVSRYIKQYIPTTDELSWPPARWFPTSAWPRVPWGPPAKSCSSALRKF